MAVVSSFPSRLDMLTWGYRGMQTSELRQAAVASGEISFQSTFDPYSFVSLPEPGTYAIQLRIRGTGFGDFDANGVPHSGTVTGASLFGPQGFFVVYFEQLNIPAQQFLDLIGSADGAALRSALLGGADLIDGGMTAGGLFGELGDRLLGQAGADTISGHGGHDTIDGGTGDDLIRAQDGTNSHSQIDGGAGIDTLSYDISGRAVVIDVAAGTAGEDIFTGVERFVGSAFDDRLTGAAGADTLAGDLGSDTISGGDGGDVLADSGGLADQLFGGGGNDQISVGHSTGSPGGADVLLDGGAGDDLLTGASTYGLQNTFRLIGGDGADVLRIVSGYRAFIEGGDGGDTVMLEGAVGQISVSLGGGADVLQVLGLIAGAPSVTVSDFAAQDRLDLDTFLAVAGYPSNAFGLGILRLAQRGGDAVVQTKFGAAVDWSDAVRLQNFDVRGLSVGAAAGAPAPLWRLGGDGPDNLAVVPGFERVEAGAGADTVTGAASQAYLRGGAGDDSIIGGSGFDDINGNMGADTCISGGGDDWVVGGKDNDSLVGSEGQNLVYGNLGSDTCDGGDGNDIVRGGQNDDVCLGGAGEDFVSGDRGDDTMTGGAGADLFHTFGGAGLDRVTDFSLAQGDRVMLDPGTQFTVSQVGADTVISMTGGGQMTLAGVSMSTLTPGWIFGA